MRPATLALVELNPLGIGELTPAGTAEIQRQSPKKSSSISAIDLTPAPGFSKSSPDSLTSFTPLALDLPGFLVRHVTEKCPFLLQVLHSASLAGHSLLSCSPLPQKVHFPEVAPWADFPVRNGSYVTIFVL